MAVKAHLKRTLEHWPALYAGLLRLRAYLYPTAGEPELRLLPRLCRGDETAIDVGANHGDYSAILVGLARDVIAVEPNPDLVRVLEARLGDEIRRQRLHLVRGALGAEAGTARLFVPDAGSGLGSLDAPPIPTAGKAIEVSVLRLDDLARGRVGLGRLHQDRCRRL
jgi:FkbM family methyltransferase